MYIHVYLHLYRWKPKHVKLHMALYKKVDLIEQNRCDFWIQHFKIVLDQLKNQDTKFVVDQGSTFYINGKPKHVKSACGAIKKVDLTEQNQCDFWIQHFKIVLNQLRKPRHQFFCRPGIYILYQWKT